MKFPYQSSFIVGAPPPSVSPGSLLRWRPFVPITISDPAQTIRRSFTRALLDTGADQTVFPERLLPTLNLQPIADGIAAYPTAQPHDPRDLAATVYHLLGVPADTMIHDLTGRPHALVIGRKIDGLLA